MAKAVQTTPSGATLTFSGLTDLGYKQAGISDSLAVAAQYAIDKIADFPETISPEAKAELYSGYFKRYGENNPPVMYAVINGHYVQATLEHIENKAVEKINVGMEYAFALSPQDFGKLKSTEPEKHRMIGDIRDKVQTYASNRLGDLKRKAKDIIRKATSNGAARETIDFTESVTRAFDALDKSVKIKEARQDSTANAVQFRVAKDAFWKAYNTK
jgi:hypothetical protein